MADLWDGPGIAGLDEFELVGRGGFSVVYRARQVSLRRPVAVKLLLTDISDDKDVRRFQRECTILGQLGRHPHIVDVYDAGITRDRRPYIVMKLYERGTLADRLRNQGPLSPPETAQIVTDVAGALQSAHDRSVVHRDIKLENLLIDDDDSVVLTDFGVAAVTDGRATMTSSMSFTESYVAPEVLDGNHFGPPSDIYALAATVYAMLTGHAPFHALTGSQRIVAIATKAPDPLPADLVPSQVSEVILAAMAKDPSDRPTSAVEFAEALKAALHEGPAIAARQPTEPERAARIAAPPVMGEDSPEFTVLRPAGDQLEGSIQPDPEPRIDRHLAPQRTVTANSRTAAMAGGRPVDGLPETEGQGQSAASPLRLQSSGVLSRDGWKMPPSQGPDRGSAAAPSVERVSTPTWRRVVAVTTVVCLSLAVLIPVFAFMLGYTLVSGPDLARAGSAYLNANGRFDARVTCTPHFLKPEFSAECGVSDARSGSAMGTVVVGMDASGQLVGRRFLPVEN